MSAYSSFLVVSNVMALVAVNPRVAVVAGWIPGLRVVVPPCGVPASVPPATPAAPATALAALAAVPRSCGIMLQPENARSRRGRAFFMAARIIATRTDGASEFTRKTDGRLRPEGPTAIIGSSYYPRCFQEDAHAIPAARSPAAPSIPSVRRPAADV